MSHESKLALERIVALVERCECPGGTHVKFYDIALEGLGLVSGQRKEKVELLIQRKRDLQSKRYGVGNDRHLVAATSSSVSAEALEFYASLETRS